MNDSKAETVFFWMVGAPFLLMEGGSWCWENLPPMLERAAQHLFNWCAKVVGLAGYAIAVATFITAVVLLLPAFLFAGIATFFEVD